MWHQASCDAGVDRVLLADFRDPVQLHFHDLRGTVVTLMSNTGSPRQEIAAITGHRLGSVAQILDRYLARSSGLAD